MYSFLVHIVECDKHMGCRKMEIINDWWITLAGIIRLIEELGLNLTMLVKYFGFHNNREKENLSIDEYFRAIHS